MNHLTDQTQYTDFVVSIKAKIRHAKSNVVLSVNRQLQQLVGEIPWTKDIVILQKCKDDLKNELSLSPPRLLIMNGILS